MLTLSYLTKELKMFDTVFDEGVLDSSMGAWLSDNPYEEGTIDHDEWEKGWNSWLDMMDELDPINYDV